ncbi:hypothetical protein J2Z22_004183 [Paenibacillus forsythiae]|uniref:Uncharacterized protein n=1 Tax=Paenibacillus forsythiae TaxID=365616 RepID=A0ABU3HCP0_9BACL|nr:hypothetical protein [Paenibacillus forsythiae]
MKNRSIHPLCFDYAFRFFHHAVPSLAARTFPKPLRSLVPALGAVKFCFCLGHKFSFEPINPAAISSNRGYFPVIQSLPFKGGERKGNPEKAGTYIFHLYHKEEPLPCPEAGSPSMII